MVVNIVLKDILEGRSYREGGYALFEIAEDAIRQGNIVSLDMKEMRSIPSLFMNTSFGDLILNYGIDNVKKLFVFNNITKSQIDKIQKYFDDFQSLIEEKKQEKILKELI
jgi:hypothetical protein